jgi:hypothetical protein
MTTGSITRSALKTLTRDSSDVFSLLRGKAVGRHAKYVSAGFELDQAITSFRVRSGPADQSRLNECRVDFSARDQCAVLVHNTTRDRYGVEVLRLYVLEVK